MKMCRLEEVQCVFGSEGCQAKFISENEDEHMDQNTQKHLALMPADTRTLRISQDFEHKLQKQQEVFEKKLRQQKEEHEQRMQQLGGQLQEQLKKNDKQIKKVENTFLEKMKEKDKQIESLKSKIQEITPHVHSPPYYYTVSNYLSARNSHTDSPPMYTHPGGYKFKLRLLRTGQVAGHNAVFVYSLKGDHDAELNVPVKFTITLQLMNQHRNEDHHTRDIQCEIMVRNSTAHGLYAGCERKYLPHGDWRWNPDKQTQYLKDDCLRFRITKIVVQ